MILKTDSKNHATIRFTQYGDPAPLDEKNITTDWIDEAGMLFDTEPSRHRRHSCQRAGFIDDAPSVVTWSERSHTIAIHRDSKFWVRESSIADTIEHRLKDTFEDADDQNNFDILIVHHTKDECWIEFYWKKEQE